ncbi:multicomponent Na+:H+ antiporter subunit B [Dethiosulfatibacter aminovorans DSM 17477]|uniref:Multicomponent Na+:H+ antiporter subunit B n=1 Tax=Dethiosulfatibacter aminovorans DSM 17477 TaxID=1121476 RepID=A0A1M6FU07_9FIRM|nr:hydrogen gas-evolving membrane-bound hydrogenase subunit E [Dethiosulfatibacter aminovorans]SHJ01168.1 multicomponent Na+:H+ antiporter subunit B [Dethiosulfatibacter aminovorans DSM 17477]
MRLASAIAIAVLLIALLLSGVSELPPFGNPYNPDNNELSHSYLERTTEETGALNIVTAIVLDYRALDTFMEASVLFTGALIILLLFKKAA